MVLKDFQDLVKVVMVKGGGSECLQTQHSSTPVGPGAVNSQNESELLLAGPTVQHSDFWISQVLRCMT